MWFCQHIQHILGEDLAVRPGLRVVKQRVPGTSYRTCQMRSQC